MYGVNDLGEFPDFKKICPFRSLVCVAAPLDMSVTGAPRTSKVEWFSIHALQFEAPRKVHLISQRFFYGSNLI